MSENSAPVVDRLRQQVGRPRSLINHATVPTALLTEAADEIDRLTQELHQIAYDDGGHRRSQQQARRALGDKSCG
jgi:hypothetical protein